MNPQDCVAQTFGFVYHDTNGQNHGPVWKTQSFLLSEICIVILLAGLLCERQFEKILLKHGWEKVSNCECLFAHHEKGFLLSVYMDDIKLAGKKQNISPTWKILMKDVDLVESTSSTMFIWVALKESVKSVMILLTNHRDMFESRISTGAKENTDQSFRESRCRNNIFLGPMTWKVTQRNVWKDVANLRTKRLNNDTKSQHHAWMTINLK